ncbi:MAG: amidohydrolase [Firmicutes bacterium]|nr:amidohydrolase [Bacillota bacterium]
MKKIDFESHFYNIESVQTLKARTDYPYWTEEDNTIHWLPKVYMSQDKFAPNLLDFAERRIKIMDKLEIEKAIISLAPGIDYLPPEESIPACKAANDALYKVTQQFPGRFLGSAILPILDVEASVAELERCVKELGFVMWQTHSTYGEGIEPDDKQFWPVWRKVAELGIFAYLHPVTSRQPKFNDYGYAMACPGLGFTIDTQASIVRIILSGMLDEIPDLKILLGHFGEALPFLMERMDNRMSMLDMPEQKNKHKPSYYFGRNIMVTTSGNAYAPAYECTKAALGVDSILIGTDYPFETMESCIEFLDGLSMTTEEREKIYYKNAARLGITL